MTEKINISLLNVQSLNNKSYEIFNYTINKNIDIFCFNETFLTDKISNINHFKNYYFIRNDRKKRGGGTGILINNSIEAELIKKSSTAEHEYILIKIKNNSDFIYLVNAYTPPESKSNYLFIEDIVKKYGDKVIIVGDLNATNKSWFCGSNNARGYALENIVNDNSLIVINNNQPTSKKSSNVIDLVISSTNFFEKISNFSVDTSFDKSDHFVVSFMLDCNIRKSPYKKLNWPNFTNEIRTTFQEPLVLTDNQSAEKAAFDFPKAISEAIEANSLEKNNVHRHIKLPKEISDLIKLKKQLQKEVKRFHCRILKNQLNNVINQIKRKTKQLNGYNWNELCSYLAEHKPSESVYWKIINKVENDNKIKSTTVLPSTNSVTDKTRIFLNFYSNIFQNNLFLQPPSLEKEYFCSYTNHSYESPITLTELVSVVKDTKNTKSSGEDELSFNLLKKLPVECYYYLLELYNYCFKNSFIPSSWKTAKIKVLKKKEDDLDNPASYRPISLINVVSRVLEKIINIRLTDWAESNNIIDKNQSGFRKYHSTQDNIFKVIETGKVAMQLGHSCGLVAFDIEKAFDKSPHNGILESLDSYKCPSLIGKWLQEFLRDRKFYVEIDGVSSEKSSISAGVPQGSPLSPLLFSLFINKIGEELGKLNIRFALFADDLIIWTNDKFLHNIEKRLQEATIIIDKYFRKIGLKLNEKKCQYIIFSNSRAPQKIELRLNNHLVEFCNNPRILGIYFDPKMNFQFHFEALRKDLITKINALKILSYKSNRINTKHLLTIYKSLILSKIQYSMLPFLVTNRATKKEIQLIQNKCLKIILNLPTRTSTDLIHNTLKIEKIHIRIANMVSNYLTSASIYNETIEEFINVHRSKNIPVKKSKRSILDRMYIETLKPIISTYN